MRHPRTALWRLKIGRIGLMALAVLVGISMTVAACVPESAQTGAQIGTQTGAQTGAGPTAEQGAQIMSANSDKPTAKPAVPTTDPTPQAGQTFEGTLVPGVSCPALRLDDGQTFALSHQLPGFDIGQKVRVTGSGFGVSASCMQEIFLVTDMVAVK